MTNKEALLAQINFPLKSASVELALVNVGVTPDTEYAPADHKQAVETALAGLILMLCLTPDSVSELDYSLTNKQIGDLLTVRSIYLKRWGLVDETAYQAPTIQDASFLW